MRKLLMWPALLLALAGSARAETVAQELKNGRPASDQPVTPAKGDLWVANGTAFRPLALGTNGMVLQADSTQSLGVKWATVGAGDTVSPAANTADYVPQWNGANSKTLKDGLAVVTTVGSPGSNSSLPTEAAVRAAISAASGDVTGPAGAVSGNIAVFNGATGKIISDGGTLANSAFRPVGVIANTVAAGDDARIVGAVQSTRSVTAGAGLSGGGDLSADRSFAVTYGTAAGTAAQGNDARITGAVQGTRQVLAGAGLTGGGDLTADRTLSVQFGNSAGQACVGNDSRLSDARTPVGTSLLSGKLWLGNGSNLAAEVSMSGYATITNAGVVTVSKVLGSDGTSNAAAGDVGEYPTPGSAAAIAIPGLSGAYGDICSIALSAGDWDISAVAVMGGNGATVTGSSFGVGTASGNSGTGLVNGDTYMSFPPPSSSSQSGSALAGIRVKPTTTPTTYYLKIIGYYTGGTPNVWGRMSARRIR